MAEETLAKRLLRLEGDPAFQRLTHEIRRTNIFTILGTADRERSHSNFWAWVLNPSESHGLGMFALRRLLAHAVDRQGGLAYQRLGKRQGGQGVWSPARNTTKGRTELTLADIQRFEPDRIIAAPGRQTEYSEVSFKNGNGKNGRIDILLFLQGPEFDSSYSNTFINILIGIECKVKSSYDHTQLNLYSRWLLKNPYCQYLSNDSFSRSLSESYDRVSINYGGIFSFGFFLSDELRKTESYKSPAPQDLDPAWSSITYDDLIRYILEPMSSHPGIDVNAASIIDQYKHLASLPNNRISHKSMNVHKALVDQLFERHKETFNIIADVLKDDSEIDELGTMIEKEIEEDVTRARHLSPSDLFEHGFAKPGDKVVHHPMKKRDLGRKPFEEEIIAELVEVDDSTDQRSALQHISGGGIIIEEPVSATRLLQRVYEANGSTFSGSGNTGFRFVDGEYEGQTLSDVYEECREAINKVNH